MSWLDEQVSLYTSHLDNVGEPASFRDIIFTKFAKDLGTIIELRKLNRTLENYSKRKSALKNTLQCFSPSALLQTKATGLVKEISRSGIMQLDFDYKDIQDYNIEELKRSVFKLPFIAFCALSCSGDGFYALVLISEPNKLAEYAQHCFKVLLEYGIKADTSKGKKINDLRYVSYDANMLVREDPEPLKIKHFKGSSDTVKASLRPNTSYKKTISYNKIDMTNVRLNKIVNTLLQQIVNVEIGYRHKTIGKVATVLGGYQHLTNIDLLDLLQSEINSNKLLDKKALIFALAAFEHGQRFPLQL